MSDTKEPTKAELTERLAAAVALNKQYDQRIQGMDPEVRAIAYCIKAVSGLKAERGYGYSSGDTTDRAAIRRVLNATAARFGVTPDFEAIAQLVEAKQRDMKTVEDERNELERLRRLEAVLGSVQQGTVWE